MNNDEMYTNYQNMVTQVNTSLVQLEGMAKALNMEETQKRLVARREKLEKRCFAVGILGEFKRGKSSLINSLLCTEIIPVDILPCTATMNRVTYDMEPHAQLRMQGGTVKSIGLDELTDYVTMLDAEGAARAENIDEAIVYYPCKFCQNGVDIVDTPGLNDNDRMTKITEEIIPKLDAVIMVMVPDSPLSQSEADFICQKLMTSDLGRMIFVVNKIDTVSEKNRARVVNVIKERIQQKVLQKVEEIHGEASEEYKDAQKMLGGIQIFPLSAVEALEGKLSGNQSLIDKSGTAAFEQGLTHMLTEDRGALELYIPLNVITESMREMTKLIEFRKNALTLDSTEFKNNQQEILEQIHNHRNEKENEKKQLKQSEANVQEELESQISDYYPQLKTELKQCVREISFDPKTVSTKKGQIAARDVINDTIETQMKGSISRLTEKLELKLRDTAGREAAEIGNFTKDLSDTLDTYMSDILKRGGKRDYVIGAASSLIDFTLGASGIDGALEGFKRGGYKGAITGFFTDKAAEAVVITVLASLGLPALPIYLTSTIVGRAAAKTLPGMIFSEDSGNKWLKELYPKLDDSIDNMVKELKDKGELEKWIRGRVDTVYQELSEALDQECETLLKDTQATIDSIKKDLLENEMQRNVKAAQYDKDLETIIALKDSLSPISDKVSRILSGNQTA